MSIDLMPKGSWAGPENELKDLIDTAAMAKKATETRGLMGLAYDDEENEDQNRLLSIVGNTAVINISGSLVNSDSYWNRFFGVTGYPEIRDAFIEAANAEGVDSIMMNIDSGGGVVKGVFELADFISQVDASIKPVRTFNAGTMASAAYLLGSRGRDINSAEMSQTGSIGVIMIHQEYTKLFEKEGVKVNVIRAGEYKALVNPYEKLSDEARAQLQSDADYIHGKFIEAVATGRELSYTYVKENMADGRVYYAEEALRLGLVDNITSIDKLVAELNDAGSNNNGNYIAQTGDSDMNLESSSVGDNDMAKKKAVLSAENQAKLAAGVPLEELDTSADDQTPEPEASEEDNTVEASAEATPELDDAEQVTAEASEESEEAPEANAEDKSDSHIELVSFLKEQNTELNTKVSEQAAEIAKCKSDLESAQAELATEQSSTEGLEGVVRDSCNRLAIGLGQSGGDYGHLSGNALVKQYAQLDGEFCKRYPVGGKVSIDADPDQEIIRKSNRVHAINSAKI